MSFFDELKRRNVIKVAIAYVVLGWLAAQVAEFATENFGAPEWALKTFVVFLMLGLPFALIMAWAFEVTPDGIKREKDVDRSKSITPQTGRKLDFTIIGVLLLVAAYFVWEARFQTDEATSADTAIPANAGIQSASTNSEVTNSLENSIAVLPFANRSNVEEDLFFTDGIHDDLLTQLAKISDLRVISRTSVMEYRDTTKKIKEIAAELGVGKILEGGIQRAGKRIRINAQLIDVATDEHLWAETFDREMTMENIFEIQTEITRHIVTAVRGELTAEESASISQLPTQNLAAYESYLQALAAINRADYDQANYIEAEFWLNKALKLDPEYAQAWAAMVEVHGQAIWMGYDSNPERFESARISVKNATRYGPGRSETLAAEGEYLYRIKNDYAASVVKYQQANQLAPGDGGILERLAVAQRRAGLFDESIANFKRVLDLDPGNSRSATLLTDTMLYIKRFEEASPLIDLWMRKFPDARDLRGQKARVYIYGLGDLQSARELITSVPPWTGNEFFINITALPLLERDYQGVIDAYKLAEVKTMLSNRSYMGRDGWPSGFAYRMLGNEQAANQQFNAAIDLLTTAQPSGTYSDAFELSNLALALAGKGMYDEALTEIDQSIEILQRSDDAIFTPEMERDRALILAMSGKHDEALAEIERLLNAPVGFSRWDLYLNPFWDFFRDDERFNKLARPLNLKETKQ